MGKLIDLTGKQFGNWTVLKKSDSTNKCGHICLDDLLIETSKFRVV